MVPARGCVISGAAAAERRKHVSKSNPLDPDGFSDVMRLLNHLALAGGGPTVWIHNICTVVSTSKRTPQNHAA